jgi:hypothetical protein
MNKRKSFTLIVCAILLIYGLIDYYNYQKNNFDVSGFVFVCNQEICEIRHKKSDGQIKYTDKIDITKIEKFSTRLEKVPRTDSEAMAIYADCKDGTSFRLSPIYVRRSSYLEKELINPLNEKLKEKPISINISFPY